MQAPQFSSRTPRLLVLGYSEAAMFLRSDTGRLVQAVIAIHGQREFPVDVSGIQKALVLNFDDSEAPSDVDPIQAARTRIRQRELAELGLTLKPPTRDHARAIIDFAREIQQIDGVLLCQCQAGVSRSAAAACLCLAAWTGPGLELDCVRYLLSVRACANPNRDLIRFGDELLVRDKRLLGAVESAAT